jgi:beta-glucosidase
MNKGYRYVCCFLVSAVVAGGQSVPPDAVYRDKTASPDDRAWDAIARMTLEEKLIFLGGDGMTLPGNERLKLGKARMADASQGIRIKKPTRKGKAPKMDMIESGLGSHNSVSFPGMLPLAGTWDKELARQFGEAMGQQCQALGIDVLLGPGINMYRVSAGGRAYEYMGEDPYLTSRVVVNYVKGLQSQGISATAKHFIANDTEFCRHFANSVVDERTLREIYLPPWKAAIQEADLGAIMTGNNQVNGIPACMHKPLVNDILRDEYGFKGICMSDWQQTTYYQNRHELVLESGHSVYTPQAEFFEPWLVQHMEENPDRKTEIEKQIDQMIFPNLRTLFAIGFHDRPLLDPVGVNPQFEEHTAIARATAEGAICLAKNEDNILPFAKDQKILFVSGAELFTGSGSGEVVGYNHVSYGNALKEKFGSSITCVRIKEVTPELLKKADVVLYNLVKHGGEGYDVPFELPAQTTAELERVLDAHDNVVVLVSSCSGFDMPWIAKAKGLLWCYYLGQERGQPLARIVSGEVSPSGKLPISIEKRFSDGPAPEYNLIGGKPYWMGHNTAYREYWIGRSDTIKHPGPEFEQFKANIKPGQDLHVPYDEGIFIGYRWYDRKKIETQFPFGHGLSYTTFEYTDMTLAKSDDPKAPVVAKVTIKNTGDMTAKEVIQIYVSDLESRVEQPLKELAGFEKVELEPGRSKTVTIPLDQNGFKFFDADAGKWVLEPGEFVIHAGSSSADSRLKQAIQL